MVIALAPQQISPPVQRGGSSRGDKASGGARTMLTAWTMLNDCFFESWQQQDRSLRGGEAFCSCFRSQPYPPLSMSAPTLLRRIPFPPPGGFFLFHHLYFAFARSQFYPTAYALQLRSPYLLVFLPSHFLNPEPLHPICFPSSLALTRNHSLLAVYVLKLTPFHFPTPVPRSCPVPSHALPAALALASRVLPTT